MADAGSGVPDGCRWLPIWLDIPEKDEDEADVGPLFLPSTIVKLSDLEWLLPSLVPPAEAPPYGWGAGRLLPRPWPSCGVALLPLGVASRSCGGAGREEGLETGWRGGMSGTVALPVTGFWLGDGGIASPRRGVLGPLLLRAPPGTGGRSRGTWEDIFRWVSMFSRWVLS